MGGLALGSYLVTRLRVRRAVRAYALAEAGVGLTALLALLLRRLPVWYGLLLEGGAVPAPLQLLLKLLLASLIIVPTTLLLGTTFPLLTEALTRRGVRLHAGIASLYRVNSLGAAAVNLLIGAALGIAGRRAPKAAPEPAATHMGSTS